MIQIRRVSKSFDSIRALNQITLVIPSGKVFGLLGTNGAGKTTLLRIMAGILQADEGEILLDECQITANPEGKRKFFYLPDDPYYFPTASMEEMCKFYQGQYSEMRLEEVSYMAEQLELDINRPIRTFSKGMKRQAFLILALCARTDYLLCDEVFDGLDPVVTEVMKHLFVREMQERELTVVMAAHKLQDLEGFCDTIGILHKGGVARAEDIREEKQSIHKLQCVFEEDASAFLKEHLDVIRLHREAYFTTLMVRGDNAEILRVIHQKNPVFCKEAKLTLEEIFVAKMEEQGYDITKVLQ